MLASSAGLNYNINKKVIKDNKGAFVVESSYEDLEELLLEDDKLEEFKEQFDHSLYYDDMVKLAKQYDYKMLFKFYPLKYTNLRTNVRTNFNTNVRMNVITAAIVQLGENNEVLYVYPKAIVPEGFEVFASFADVLKLTYETDVVVFSHVRYKMKDEESDKIEKINADLIESHFNIWHEKEND